MLRFESPVARNLSPNMVGAVALAQESRPEYRSRTLERLNVSPEEESYYRHIESLGMRHPAAQAAERHFREAGDTFTRGHTDRVTELATRTAIHMMHIQGCPDILEDDLLDLFVGGKIHDTGKLLMQEAIYAERKLTDEELIWIHEHPTYSVQFGIAYGASPASLGVAGHHHDKNKDTTFNYGAPDGMISGELRKPLLERIASAADVYDSLCSERPYRTEMWTSAAAHDKIGHLLDMEDAVGGNILQSMREIVPPEDETLAALAVVQS